MTYIGIPSSGSRFWRDAVNALVDLPASGVIGEVRFVIAEGDPYYWDGAAWVVATDAGGDLATHEALTAGAHGISSFGASLVNDADASAARTTLGLGTASTSATGDFESSGSVATHAALTSGVHGISAFGSTLVDDTDASAARTTLGLGSFATISSLAHSSTTGLTSGDDHTQYALLAGRAGHQTLIGSTASGGTLTLQSTSHATRGKILFDATAAYDEVNTRLGIGTTSPLRSLDVRGSAQVGRTSLASTKCAIDAYWNTNPVATNEVQSAILSEIDTTNDSYTAFQVQCFAGTLRYRGSASESVSAKGARVLDASCFVYNTGTTEVAGGARFDIRNLSTGTITNLYGNWVISAANSGGGAVTNFFGLKVDSQSIATNNYGVYLNLASGTGRWNIYSAGTADNYMAGMLGIGTTTPLYKLHVSGASSPALWVESTDDSAPYITGNANRSLAARDLFSFGGAWNGNEVCRIAFRSGNDTVNKDDGYMRFMTANDSSTLTERMTITQDGLIGMGVSAPSARLHVISTTEQLRVGYNTSNYLSTTVNSTGGTTFAVTGTNSSISLTSSGTGIVSTSSNFTVNGSAMSVGGALSTATGVWVRGTLTGTTQRQFYCNATYDSTVTTAAALQLVDTADTGSVITQRFGLRINELTLSGTATLANNTGIYLPAMSSGSTYNRAFVSETNSSATGAYNLYISGTANNYLAGSLAVGTATITAKLSSLATTEQLRLQYDASNYFSTTVGSTGGVTFDAVGAGAGFTFSDSITLADAKDLIVNTTTGTKIGTATTQKLGFYNATPIVQRSGAAQAAVATTAATNVTPYGYSTAAQADAIITLVNELRAWAVAQGFIKGSA